MKKEELMLDVIKKDFKVQKIIDRIKHEIDAIENDLVFVDVQDTPRYYYQQSGKILAFETTLELIKEIYK